MIRTTAKTQHQTRDGGWVNLAQTFNERSWERFLSWADSVGFGELFRQFGDAEDRLARGSELIEAMQGAMATLDAEEAWQAGQRLGLPWGAIRQPEQWLDDPHADARGFFQQVRHEDGSQALRYPGPPFAFTEHPGQVERAPHLGEHNAAVYGELGYDREQLSDLSAAGVI